MSAGRIVEGGGEGGGGQLVAGEGVVVVPDGLGEAGGVGEEVVQGDAALVGGNAVEVPADAVGGAQPALGLELDDRGGGELLGHRRDVVHGVAAGPGAGFGIGRPATGAGHRPATARGDDGAGSAFGPDLVEVLLHGAGGGVTGAPLRARPGGPAVASHVPVPVTVRPARGEHQHQQPEENGGHAPAGNVCVRRHAGRLGGGRPADRHASERTARTPAGDRGSPARGRGPGGIRAARSPRPRVAPP